MGLLYNGLQINEQIIRRFALETANVFLVVAVFNGQQFEGDIAI